MALMKCPECEGNVSDKAVFCPHCGFPIAEKGTEAVYELEKGRPEYTGLAGLLRMLAVISWIGGLIIAVVGAITVIPGRYRDETTFSFGQFLVLLGPFVIYGAILMGLGKMAEQIAGTHGVVMGMRLVRKDGLPPRKQKVFGASGSDPKNAPEEKKAVPVKEEEIILPVGAADEYGWLIDEKPGFVRCPGCDSRMSADYMKYRSACPDCGYEHVKRENG